MNDIKLEHLQNIKGVGVIVTCKGHILLGKRKDSGEWCLAGGGIEPGEEPKQAAIRELHEEFGIKVNDLLYIGVSASPANPYKKESGVGCGVDYLAEFNDRPEVILKEDEMTEYIWISSGRILSLENLFPSSCRTLMLYLRVNEKQTEK